jgi:hypothetical protein
MSPRLEKILKRHCAQNFDEPYQKRRKAPPFRAGDIRRILRSKKLISLALD